MIKARAAHAINADGFGRESIGREKEENPPSRSIHDKSTLEFLRKRVENGVGGWGEIALRGGNMWILEEFVGVKILEIVLGKSGVVDGVCFFPANF